ncbi:GspE/PulE family protein [Zavarzinella formosa]|uniref:GspE/PulE family protein n=1 Tax=Zavarzinella formosa TaxID=360055 RepID=UPI0002F7C1AE|nr:ATPase, T2SS/T4P/T4SS family [Zavarzinella formosa]
MFLIERLRENGQLSDTDAKRAEELHAQDPNRPLHELMIEKGIGSEMQILTALGEEFGLEFVDLSHTIISAETLSVMPTKIVHRKGLMPISRNNGTLVVATSNPYDVNTLDELQTLTGLEITPVLGSQREISRLIKHHFGVGGETVQALVQERDDVELLEGIEADDSELAKQAQEASVVKLVNEILIEAINERASDIHVEPEENAIRIRYRIDGLLQTQMLPPEINRFASAIISRIKIMSRLNIAEKRLPQDGRIKMRVQGREVDVRVSIIPMIHGEGIVMRLLDKGRMVFNLANCGMLPPIHRTFKKLIDLPHGIVLVTGPTGSGKSTTLYSALNEIKDEVTKIITVEDPVEYQQPGISQIQTHAKIGLTFATALRSILRHDPDVILIGEMRDKETSDAAIQASLTGHMVFSTLHTNDSPSAFTRLIDIGVEPFLVASTVEGIMAQRLVRTICKDCKTEYVPEMDDLPIDFPHRERFGDMSNAEPTPLDARMQHAIQDLISPDKPLEGKPKIHKGLGCRACRQSGYRGRTGIHELLINSDVLRDLVVNRANANLIRLEAMKAGMLTLRQDGWLKVLRGSTTIDEVNRTTAGDMIG